MPNRNEWFSLQYYLPVALGAVRILFILVFAYVLTSLAERAIRALRKYSVRMMRKSGTTTEFELEKRADTIGGVARKSIIFLIWTIALLMVLQKLGFEIAPLLASLGVVGVAVGFGAQSLVKDVLAGIFLLLENQIRVNDVAVINGTGGLVEEINLRTTVLRGENGAVHIFPNGSIVTLANLTRDYSYYIFEVTIDYASNTDQAVAELRRLAEGIASEEEFKDSILAPLEVFGVEKLGDSGVMVKARFKTLPGKQFPVGREMNRRIKQRFADAGIQTPPNRVVHVVQTMTPELRAELKAVVKEVLSESR